MLLSLLKKIFQKPAKKDASKELSSQSSIDKLTTLFSEGKFEEVLLQADDLLNSADRSTQLKVKNLLGLCYFRKQQYDKSVVIFKELTSQSKDPDHWFNLMTSATLNRNLDLSEQAFNKSIQYKLKSGENKTISVPEIYFYYMLALRDIGEYEKAFVQFENLKQLYCSLVITDSTFLYIRGVPFFEQCLEEGKKILENIPKTKARDFLSSLSQKIDSDGQNYLDKFESTIEYAS